MFYCRQKRREQEIRGGYHNAAKAEQKERREPHISHHAIRPVEQRAVPTEVVQSLVRAPAPFPASQDRQEERRQMLVEELKRFAQRLAGSRIFRSHRPRPAERGVR